MKNRIRDLRKHLDLTQIEFGEKIGVKGNTVTGYETGIRVPSDAVILSICREFNVSETWLRTGEGSMFVQLTRNDQIAAFVGDIMRSESDSFKARFIAMLSGLGEDDWTILEKMVQQLAGAEKKES